MTDDGYDWATANEPCESCNPDGAGKPPTRSKPPPSSTVAYVDEVPQYVKEGGQPTMDDMREVHVPNPANQGHSRPS